MCAAIGLVTSGRVAGNVGWHHESHLSEVKPASAFLIALYFVALFGGSVPLLNMNIITILNIATPF